MATTGISKARKPSKVVKPKKSKKNVTISSKNHRFKPFSERIANLKIDPVRRRRGPEDQEELNNNTATYFGRSLEEWRDLNQSSAFTSFAKEAAPLCDSLPVVLHNEEKLVDLLVAYIERGDGLALEPLLSLLSHLAHDLDSRFEKHFQRSVSAVTATAAKHSDPAVVEWSFNCLAWLFKYLSRLLVPDLRPLYNLMAPYLGKETQKPFIIRFAAESMSFLVRKAASKYDKDKEPLDLFLNHVIKEAPRGNDVTSNELYEQGVTTLLTESIKGVQSGMHSSGLNVLQSMLATIEKQLIAVHEAAVHIATGTITSLIHHTNAETFYPVQDTVMNFVEGALTSARPDQIKIATQLVFTIATVRKGTRITHWSPLVNYLRTLVQLEHSSLESDEPCSHSILSAVAVVFQGATIDTVLPALDVFEVLRSGRWKLHFLSFCDLFARLGCERFESFLLPQFKKFVIEQYSNRDDDIFQYLPILSSQAPEGKKIACGDDLQTEIVHRLTMLSRQPESYAPEHVAAANSALSAVRYLRLNDQVRGKLQSELLRIVMHALEMKRDEQPTELDDFALGTCLACTLDHLSKDDWSAELWKMLSTESSRFSHLEKFWSNLHGYMSLCPSSEIAFNGTHMDALETSLVQSLSMPSSAIRKSALEVIQSIYKLRDLPVPDILETAITIESTPVSFEASRSMSMHIRRLSAGYSEPQLDRLLQRAIPTYCFGLLHLQLSQAWEDSVNALAEIAKTTVGEDTITNLVQLWLEGAPSESGDRDTAATQSVLDIESQGLQVRSDFECSNYAKVSAICQQVWETSNSGYLSKEGQFRLDHRRISSVAPNAREQALRVLNKLPAVAEKRSRMLVPVLLKWASNADVTATEENRIAPSSRWNRKDQKAMLEVFAQFTNPKVLFKSEEAYAALLNLCANGDVEIQRSALKAIFTWKDSSVNQYEERLTNLLDEVRFREEISIFVQDNSGDDETNISSEARDKVMPILLRLLYGRAISGGKHGQGSRRKAIFVALSSHDADVLDMFVHVALGSMNDIELLDNENLSEQALSKPTMHLRQQFGMLNMIEDMLETMGAQLERSGINLMNAVLLCSVAASRQLERDGELGELQDSSLLRSIRQSGIQCLVKAFSTFQTLSLAAYARVIVSELIAPRIEKFASENTQSVSGMLRLLSAWASSRNTQRFLIDFDQRILDAVAALLEDSISKDDVRLFILENIVDELLSQDGDICLSPSHVTRFVRALEAILSHRPSKPVLDASVSSFTLISSRVHDGSQAGEVVQVCSELLIKPSKAVSNATKTGLLRTMLPLIQTFGAPHGRLLYNAVCGLFSRLQEQQSRVLLSSVLVAICKSDDALLETAVICQDLNTVGSRLDEVDHAKRESGFTRIYEHYKDFSLQQWQGIVHNSLFFVRDSEDLVNRTSASRALERFIDAAASNAEDFKPSLSGSLLPGIVYGMKSLSELVRAQYLHLLGHLVEAFPDWATVKDMSTLTADGDQEASFFANVLHIQQHRRLRALRRLADFATHLTSTNVTQIFFPLLEHFVFEQAEGDSGRALADQAILTLGALSKALSWSAFRATFKRYATLLGSETHEKFALRLLSVLVDALYTTPPEDGNDSVVKEDGLLKSTDDASMVQDASVLQRSGDLNVSKVNSSERSDIVTREMLTPLAEYLHRKDESTVDRRMPVAIAIVKILLSLPDNELSSRLLPPVLTDVCHVLRSRSQEARDQTRKTLGHMLRLLGPSYLGFIVKELRVALQRGYQLHVLSFTVHHLLVTSVDEYQPGDLDQCLSELMSIVMDDIFGVTGQEKEAEDYKSSMKEVKSSKSFDTLELLARVTPVQQLGRLIKPLQALLSEKLDSKTLKKTDDALARLKKGIDQNPTAKSRDMLIVCHEILRNASRAQTTTASSRKPTPLRNTAHRHKHMKVKGSTVSPTHKIASFAMDLLRKVLRRHEDLMTPGNLCGFIPIVSDTLVQGQEEEQCSALKLLSTIMNVPLPELEDNVPSYAAEAVKLIKTAPNTTTDSAKASLDLITSILRDKRSAQIRDRDIADVLKALKADLDEPDRQGIIYKFLRAVLGRKILIAEVYEIMDDVGTVLVTNADRNVRESARSAYVQFILDYPQSKSRWKQQSGMIVTNLRYEKAPGRQSIMELLYQVISKLPDELFAKLQREVFVALVQVHTGDPDRSCREMAGMLIARLFERANEEQMNDHFDYLDKWLENDTKAEIPIAALQCWTIFLRAKLPTTNRVEGLRNKIDAVVEASIIAKDSMADGVAENALKTFTALTDVSPSISFAKQSKGIWKRVHQLLSQHETGVSEIAARLLETYFTHLASSSSKAGNGLSALPLRGSGGLELDGDNMLQICYSCLRVLYTTSEDMETGFITQNVRNIVFLGRCFAASGMKRRLNAQTPPENGDESSEGGSHGVRKDTSALGYVFSRLCYVVRQENINPKARSAAVDCLSALVSAVDKIPNITSLLRPLYTLTDSSVPQTDSTLSDKARELMDLIQKKAGKDAYIEALSIVRAEATGRRDDRRRKRRFEAVSMPGKRRKIR